jgi:hypothetical protein
MGCLLAFSMTACTPQPAIAPQKIISTNPCLDAILAEIADPATDRRGQSLVSG